MMSIVSDGMVRQVCMCCGVRKGHVKKGGCVGVWAGWDACSWRKGALSEQGGCVLYGRSKCHACRTK